MATGYSFMSIAAAVHDAPGMSFEEVRIEDYLKSFSTTSRPPPPCPQQPTDENQRRVLHLPPLFKPVPEQSTSGTLPLSLSSASSSSAPTRPANPAELPDAQGFFTTTHEADVYNIITAIPVFSGFSFEELRYYAYLKGNRVPPPSVQLAPFVQAPPLPPSSGSAVAPSTAMMSRPGFNASASASDIMQSISCQPAFAGHSPEELRVACMLAGRELNSSEILAVVAQGPPPPVPPAATRSSLFSK